MTYISSAAATAEPATNRSSAKCVFCRRTESGPDAELILDRNDTTLIVLNKFPYVRGHTMVCPNRHVGTWSDLTAEERRDIGRETRRVARALRELYEPETVYIGSNLGQSAGAGVPGHLHVHLVPRIAADRPTSVPPHPDQAPEALADSSARFREALHP
jgi:diadenosine tetraphosphate (Ap4A) HIT family hydrolase